MPTFTMTKTYDDGVVLTEAMLDSMKSSTETFLNTTKLDGDNIQDGGLDSDTLATGAVIEVKIASGAVTATKLGTSAVETAKINDLAVTTAKISDLAVTAAKLGASAVETAKISDLAVTAAKLGASAVETAKINNLAVTAAKIANGTITTTQIAPSADIVGTQLAGGTVTLIQISSSSITAGTYSPTVTNAGNVGAISVSAANYMRIGNIVHVSGRVNLTPTAGAGNTIQVTMTLPVSSNFNTVYQASGTVCPDTFGGNVGAYLGNSGGHIESSSGSTTVLLQSISSGAAQNCWYTYSYEII